MRHLAAALFLLLSSLASLLPAQEIGFVERFAWADDREAVLKELIPGTRDYYYYHCLHYQNTQQFDEAERILKAWVARHKNTARAQMMRNRQALLTYGAGPQASLEHVRKSLGLRFDHQRERIGEKPNLPNALAPQRISRETLKAAALNRPNLDGFENSALQWLAGTNLDARRRRILLSRLSQPDLPGLVELIVADLKTRDSGGFGSLGIHGQLTLKQLDDLLKQKPDVRNNGNFVNTYLAKLRHGDDDNWRDDPDVQLAYLERLWKFVSTLGPVHNSLKAHALYHRLHFDRTHALYDKERFFAYLRLPRNSAYINPKYLELAENRRYRANLAQKFNTTLLPPVGNDEPLVRSYFLHYFVKEDAYDSYLPLVRTDYLKQIFAETKAVNGLGDPEQWASLLSPAAYQALKDRVDLDFDHQNRKLFGLNEAVALDVHVKNVEQLIVKVFHINTTSYSRQLLREVNTDIELDGLIPNQQQTLDYKDPPLRRVRRHFEFPELTKPGVYVVDFIGNGRSSRAVVRKGSVSHVMRTTPSGQAVVVLTEDNKIAKDAVIWFAGREHEPNEQGVILLPFTTQSQQTKSFVVHHGGQAYVRRFVNVPEQYSLVANMYVDRESLRTRAETAVLIRPQLYLAGSPVSLSMLEEVSLTIASTDLDGVQSQVHVKDLELSHDGETSHVFQVPARLATIEFVLEAKVKQVSRGNAPATLADGVSYTLNQIEKTHQVADVHLAWSDNDYSVSLLGRTGEPLPDRAVHVELKHRDFKQLVHADLQTDNQGRVQLGSLEGILWVAAKERAADSARRQWVLRRDRSTLPANLNGVAGETIRLPAAGIEATREHLSLLETRGGQVVADRFNNLKLKDGMLHLEKLPAGDYRLQVKGVGQVAIRVTKGPSLAGFALGQIRQLELKPSGATLTGVSADDKDLVIRVGNADKFTRVHIFANRFMPAYSAFTSLARGGDAEPLMAAVAARRSLFVEGRNIGDEYEYILRRQFAPKFPGNMLERPSLLLNPWSLRSTETSTSEAAGGDEFGGVADPSAPPSTPPTGRRAPGPLGQGLADFASLNWLHAGAVIANLTPDEKGEIRVPRDELGGGQHVRIVAVHPRGVVQRTLSLPAGGAKRSDLRLADGLDSQKHFLQQQRVAIVKPGDTFTLRSVDSARFEPYDSLRSVFTLYETLSKDPKLAEFRFVLDWHTLDDKQKREKYSKYACHELNFYLLHKDAKFFQSAVQPFLASKRDKTFLDQWLLERGLSEHLDPWRHAQLNIVERILIGQQIDPERSAASRHVDELVDLIPIDLDRDAFLFETAVAQSALAVGADLAFGRMDAVEKQLATLDTPFGAPTAETAPAPAPKPRASAQPTAPAPPGGGAPPEPDAPATADKLSRRRFRDGRPASGGDRFGDADAKGEARSVNGLGMMGGGGMGGGGGFGYFPGRYAGKAAAPLYQILDKTKEWAENNYYHLPIQQQNAQLVSANKFWQDYARHQDGPFLSPHLAEASRNFTECMLALAVLDLPVEAEEHEAEFEGQTMKLTAAGPVIMFHEEIREPDGEGEETPILVSQNLFRNDDRYRHVKNQRLDKYVTDEFLTHIVYGCQIVVTNPTSSPQKLELLVQIPEGSLPLGGGKVTRSVPLQLQPYNTQTMEFLFYFPAVGQYPMFPVHVSRNQTLVASAEPRTLRVVESLSRVDRESWAYISQHGTEPEVVKFLEDNNLLRLNLDKIAFRMGDEQFFETVTGLLVKRHVYNHTLWSYSVKHDRPPRVRQYLQHADNFVARCGPYLDSPLLVIDPVLRKQYQHLDYKPLVNARAHQLGAERTILNGRAHAQYHALLNIHSFRGELDDDDRMSATYYLLLQDRVEEGIGMFRQVNAERLQTRLQHDYFTAYVSFFTEDLEAARNVTDKYADHPVDRWRNTFAAVRSQLDEIEGAGADVIDEQNRDQRQTELADKSPSFDFKVDAGKVKLDYQNLTSATVNYYLMDIELLFSRNPFVQQFSGQFSHILPNQSRQLKFDKPKGTTSFDLPAALNNQNVLVEITADGVTKTQAWYSNSLTIQLTEQYGQLRVADDKGVPLPKAYVKTFARLKNGQVKFYKDGYTDLRGRFDYSSLSTNELDNVKQFALLIMSDEHGAVVREASPPAR